MKLNKYLRELYIFRSYLVKNQWELSSWLREDVLVLINSIDKEILDIKNMIEKYIEKEKNRQISLFDRS